jgi:FkbM family methyltransferase
MANYILQRLLGKCRQVASFFRHTHTPLILSLDALRMKRTGSFVAVSMEGLKLALKPRESFTFYENLIRRDYFGGGIVLKPDFTVVDIGANIGAFSILAASIVGPRGRVFSFEPVPETFERLRQNVALNGLDNVVCRRAAIDDKDGVLNLQVSRISHLSTAHLYDRNGVDQAPLKVPCLTLGTVFSDNQIDHVNLMKIDCEGSEYGIIETLTPEVAARIYQIAMEVHPVPGKSPGKLKATLEALGFDVEGGYIWFAINRARMKSLSDLSPP